MGAYIYCLWLPPSASRCMTHLKSRILKAVNLLGREACGQTTFLGKLYESLRNNIIGRRPLAGSIQPVFPGHKKPPFGSFLTAPAQNFLCMRKQIPQLVIGVLLVHTDQFDVDACGVKTLCSFCTSWQALLGPKKVDTND